MIETFIRDELVDGVGPWVWLRDESGAWDGPKADWLNDHRHRIFKYIKRFDYVLQAGGNQGLYPKIYAKYFKQVLTFEPDYMNFHVLCQNCQTENVIKIQAALGFAHQTANINRKCMDNTGMHRIKRHEPGNIPILKIDDFVLPTLDLIHLDIEDMEIEALHGGKQTILNYKPVVVVEKANVGVTNFLTKECGYEFQERSGDDGIFISK